jgi:hypothetical protein
MPTELEIIKQRVEDNRLKGFAHEVGRARRDKETASRVENPQDYDSMAGKAGEVLRLLPQVRFIGTMDAAARIRYARELLSPVFPPERVEKLFKDLAAETARKTTGHVIEPPRPVAAAPAAAPSAPGLEWPSEKWKGSPEELSRKQHALITFLRRVWVPFIEENRVLVTREILKAHDTDAASALKGYLHRNKLPPDIRIFTTEQLQEHLSARPVSANSLPALAA